MLTMNDPNGIFPEQLETVCELSNIPLNDNSHLTVSQRPLEPVPVTQIKFAYQLLSCLHYGKNHLFKIYR